jgi:hypothetical protein
MVTGPMDHALKRVSEKAIRYHNWIEWVVMTCSPSTFVENKYNRKNSKMQPISRNTYNKYKDLIKDKIVLRKIKEELPPTFMLYFDGWSCDGEHYLCMFAVWTNKTGAVVIR